MDTLDRRLAAILVADVVGFSKLMAEDEVGTLAALKAHRNITDPVILNHGGRIVKTTGDGMLVEYPTALAALDSAREVQGLMRTRNGEIPEARRMLFRIGINVGDISVDESGDVFGNGVNVAARLEAIAEPGGISVSNAVREAVRRRTDAELHDAGEQLLKNIPEPVQVWRVDAERAHEVAVAVTSTQRRTVATVAVLPFSNMGGDAEEEYFADGITEDLLTALSHNRELAVVARNSTFAYKGRTSDTRRVARELDATHVVEGSVRRAGNRVRVTAQLSEAESGHQLWAERLDRELDDIFELQDDLVNHISAKLFPTLFDTEARRRLGSNGRSVDAWDLTMRGQFHVNLNTVEGFLRGIELFDQAKGVEPMFAAPVGKGAIAWLHLGLTGWRDEAVNPWDKLQVEAMAAYRLDHESHDALAAMAAAKSYSHQPLEGAEYARRLIEHNPYGAFGYHWLGHNLGFAGAREEAIPVLTDGWRLGRYEPWRHHVATNLAYAHYFNHDYEPAMQWARQSARTADLLQAHIILAAVAAQLTDSAMADRYAKAVLAARPRFSVERYRKRIPFLLEADQEHLVSGLSKAGLPA